jgi:hypothetical protein
MQQVEWSISRAVTIASIERSYSLDESPLHNIVSGHYRGGAVGMIAQKNEL